MRLFEEMIKPFMNLVIRNVTDPVLPENKFVQKMRAYLGKVNELVCPLPTKSQKYEQYSVFSDHDSLFHCKTS